MLIFSATLPIMSEENSCEAAESSCVICFESFPDSSGIKCSSGHYLCQHDFTSFIAENVLTQVFKLRRNKGKVMCPSHNCDGEFEVISMFSLLEKRERSRYISIIGQINHEHSIVIRLRDAILDILTLKCPKCRTAVDPSPDACSAIMCLNCGSHYCNCCFMSFDSSDTARDRAAAHEHCATHKPISSNKEETRDAFLPTELVTEGQRSYQIEQLKKCLTLAMTSKTYGVDGHHDVNIALILAYEDLTQLGIDVQQLAESVEGGMLDDVAAGDSAEKSSNKSEVDRDETIIEHEVIEGFGNLELNDGPADDDVDPTPGKKGGPQLVNAIATLNSTAIAQIISSIPADQLDLNFIDPRSGLPLTSLALITGQIELAQQLITLGANVSLCDRRQHTILYIAIESGSLKIVDHILKCNPTVELNQPVSMNRNHYCPLHVAARFGHGHIIRYLVKRGAALEQIESELRYTPLLMTLALRLDWAATELILLGAQFWLSAGQNRCALHLIAERGASGLLQLILNLPVYKTHRFDVNQKVNADGMTMLHVACLHNQAAMAQQLMEMGANVNILSTNQMLPFSAALFGNNQLSAVLMMKHGAMTNFAFKERKTMYVAVEKGMEQVVELLLTKCGYGVNASTVTDENGERPLHIAALYKQNKLIPVLLHHKADVTLVEKLRGLTPIMLAVLAGNELAVRMMLPLHPTVHTVFSVQGRNCLYMAAEKGNTNILSLILIRCKADINGIVEREAKLTALHVACIYDKAHVVRFLLQMGADVNVVGVDNKSPLDCAREHSAFSAEAAIMEFINDLIAATAGMRK